MHWFVHAVVGTQNALPAEPEHWEPGPHEPATDGLHDDEHQLMPLPLVRHVPVEQSEPAVQNRH